MKSIGRYISILYRKNLVYLNTVLSQYGITAGEYPFLFCLYKNDGFSQEEISSYLMIDKSATTRAVNSLIEKGLIKKEKDISDKRVYRIFLTDKATSIKGDIQKHLAAWTDFLLEGEDPSEIETTFKILGNMIDKVKNIDIRERWQNDG